MKMLLQLVLLQIAPPVLLVTRARSGPTGARAVPSSSLRPLPVYTSTVALAACCASQRSPVKVALLGSGASLQNLLVPTDLSMQGSPGSMASLLPDGCCAMSCSDGKGKAELLLLLGPTRSGSVALSTRMRLLLLPPHEPSISRGLPGGSGGPAGGGGGYRSCLNDKVELVLLSPVVLMRRRVHAGPLGAKPMPSSVCTAASVMSASALTACGSSQVTCTGSKTWPAGHQQDMASWAATGHGQLGSNGTCTLSES
jgi:hypothetical protein